MWTFQIPAKYMNKMRFFFSDIAKQYPPSLRIIVQETNIKKLKIGELFLITFKGGSLGREGKHDVIIPDINCSKYHLKFVYDESENGYTCIDLGSRNGTLMNGKRMSNAKQESEPMQLVHGAVLQIGQTKLLCHIHDGHSTVKARICFFFRILPIEHLCFGNRSILIWFIFDIFLFFLQSVANVSLDYWPITQHQRMENHLKHRLLQKQNQGM